MLLHDLKSFLCSSGIAGQDKLRHPIHLAKLSRDDNGVSPPGLTQRPVMISDEAAGGSALRVAEEDEAAAEEGVLGGDLGAGGGDGDGAGGERARARVRA